MTAPDNELTGIEPDVRLFTKAQEVMRNYNKDVGSVVILRHEVLAEALRDLLIFSRQQSQQITGLKADIGYWEGREVVLTHAALGPEGVPTHFPPGTILRCSDGPGQWELSGDNEWTPTNP